MNRELPQAFIPVNSVEHRMLPEIVLPYDPDLACTRIASECVCSSLKRLHLECVDLSIIGFAIQLFLAEVSNIERQRDPESGCHGVDKIDLVVDGDAFPVRLIQRLGEQGFDHLQEATDRVDRASTLADCCAWSVDDRLVRWRFSYGNIDVFQIWGESGQALEVCMDCITWEPK